ncbi:MAG: hypothetical protein PHV20_14245 [Bacteroidales bacterium]|nr:hypothetical protein [Bacteroidales bacterium]
MNLFKMKTSWSNAEFIPLKVSIASVYLLIGAYFHQFVCDYWIPFLVLAIIALIWALVLWISKMRQGNNI